MRELLPILQNFLADLNQAGSGDKARVYWLANLADGRIRAMLGSGPTAPSADFVFPPNATVTASGSLAMAPVAMFGNAATTVPLPADIVRQGETRQDDLNYATAMLLAVIAWLLTFVGPIMISKLPQADQSTMSDYYSGIPGLALMHNGASPQPDEACACGRGVCAGGQRLRISRHTRPKLTRSSTSLRGKITYGLPHHLPT